MSQLTVKPLGYAAGAEITNIDLRHPLDQSAARQINDAWLEHLVVVFPNQPLTAQQQLAFARNFGEIAADYGAFGDNDNPGMLAITNRRVGGKLSDTHNVGRSWHTDLAFTIRPVKASLLICKEKPDVGGDTMFANMYMAYDTLSDPMQAFANSLEAIHDIRVSAGVDDRDADKTARLKRENPPVIQPLVRTHPETGRKSLMVGQRVREIVGLSKSESEAMLALLNAHATSPEFVYRHRWSVGDLLMWDNRCTMHIALGDYDRTQVRHMDRCSIMGEEVTGRLADEKVDNHPSTKMI